MKDYSLSKLGRTGFILNYEIKDNQIIVNYADGRKEENLYTKEEEKRILEQMKGQVLFANPGHFDDDFKRSLLWTILSAWNIGIDTYNAITIENARILFGLFGAWFIFYGGCNIIGMIDSKSKLEDLKKNRLFLYNEDLFKEQVEVNDDMSHNAPVTETRQIMTLNDIDKMSYGEVKNIIEITKSNREKGIVLQRQILSKKRINK